jgi:serine/threonine protein kinase
MPLYSKNLSSASLTPEQVCYVGMQLLGCLQLVHEGRRTFNDLKPENIMIDDQMEVTLIDFGLCQKYVKSGLHLEQGDQVTHFQGNLTFASLNQLNFLSTTRRDDILSLTYLLIYLISGNQMPNYKCDPSLPSKVRLKKQIEYK